MALVTSGPFQRDPDELLPSWLGALSGKPPASPSAPPVSAAWLFLVLQPFIPHELVCTSNEEKSVTSQA